jgi:hypothetical protein
MNKQSMHHDLLKQHRGIKIKYSIILSVIFSDESNIA